MSSELSAPADDRSEASAANISAIGIPHTDIPIRCKSIPAFGFSKGMVNSARLFLAMNTAKNIVMKYIAICAPSVPRNITVIIPTTSNMIQNRKLVSAILISLYSLDFLSIYPCPFSLIRLLCHCVSCHFPGWVAVSLCHLPCVSYGESHSPDYPSHHHR